MAGTVNLPKQPIGSMILLRDITSFTNGIDRIGEMRGKTSMAGQFLIALSSGVTHRLLVVVRLTKSDLDCVSCIGALGVICLNL